MICPWPLYVQCILHFFIMKLTEYLSCFSHNSLFQQTFIVSDIFYVLWNLNLNILIQVQTRQELFSKHALLLSILLSWNGIGTIFNITLYITYVSFMCVLKTIGCYLSFDTFIHFIKCFLTKSYTFLVFSRVIVT